MPTYRFECKGCSQIVTVTSPMAELKTPGCLNCQEPMTRNYTFNAVQFKGQGFYSKDKNE